jgi:hypothetical protein
VAVQSRQKTPETLVAPFANERVVLSYGRQRGNSVNKFSEHELFANWFPSESVCPQRSHFCNNANCAIRINVSRVNAGRGCCDRIALLIALQ